MDLSEPAGVLASGLTIPLLRALASRSTGATAEQVRRAAGMGTARGTRSALDRFVDHGLVIGTQVGERTMLYQLNRDHVLYPVVQATLAASDALPRRLADVLSTWEPSPECAALFGSAARRDGGIDSDVDLLLIRPSGIPADEPQWSEQLHDMRDQVRAWTGNHLQLLDRTLHELGELVLSGEAIVDEWIRDAVTVYGGDVRQTLEELR